MLMLLFVLVFLFLLMRGSIGGGSESLAAATAVGSCTPGEKITDENVSVGVEASVNCKGVKGVGNVDPGGPEPGAGG